MKNKKKKATIIFIAICSFIALDFFCTSYAEIRNQTTSAINQKYKKVISVLAIKNGYALDIKQDRKTIDELIQLYARANGVNSCVMKGIIKQENTYNSISETNDVGLMGVNIQSAKDICKIKGTSEEIAQQLLEPETNLACGSKILALKQKQFGKWEGIRRYNGFVDNQKHKYYKSNKDYRENVLRKAIEEDC